MGFDGSPFWRMSLVAGNLLAGNPLGTDHVPALGGVPAVLIAGAETRKTDSPARSVLSMSRHSREANILE